jgi:hypothetical protein
VDLVLLRFIRYFFTGSGLWFLINVMELEFFPVIFWIEVAMRKKIIIAGVFCVVLGLIIASWALTVGFNDEPKENQERKSTLYRGLEVDPIYSKSYLEENPSAYAFDSVLQGDEVKHDFIIKNSSKEPLSLSKVKSCCGSFIESFSLTIQPGEEGKISVLMLTDSFGGRAIQGTISAKTSDPKRPEIQIQISLPVREFAKIDPLKIILTGSFRDNLTGTSTIEPAKEYPFAITGIKPKKGIDILYDFKEIVQDNKKRYLVTATNKRKKSGIYRDILFIQTDNKSRPEFKIRVEGYIQE